MNWDNSGYVDLLKKIHFISNPLRRPKERIKAFIHVEYIRWNGHEYIEDKG